MKFRKTESLIKAEQVINILQNNSERTPIECSIECYQNGREHGFILWNFWVNSGIDFYPVLHNQAFYICQGRRTDSIVIYSGSYVMQSISDDAYQNPIDFGYDSEKAAKYIVDTLQSAYFSFKHKETVK